MRRIKTVSNGVLICILSLLLLNACNLNQTNEDAQNNHQTTQAQQGEKVMQQAPLAQIYGVQIKAQSVWFRVVSTGCTSSRNFAIDIEQTADKTFLLSIFQTKADRCKALPRLVAVELPLDEYAQYAGQISVKNEVLVPQKGQFPKNNAT